MSYDYGIIVVANLIKVTNICHHAKRIPSVRKIRAVAGIKRIEYN